MRNEKTRNKAKPREREKIFKNEKKEGEGKSREK